jgi:hypothetical protein
MAAIGWPRMRREPIGWAKEQGQIRSGVGPFLEKRMRERNAFVAPAVRRPWRQGGARAIVADLPSVQVAEWQRCAGLPGLDRNVASDLADDRQVQQLAYEEALIGFEVRHYDLEEIVRLAGDQVTRDHFGHSADRVLELECTLVGMSVNLDADKHRKSKVDTIAPEDGSITIDDAVTLQTFHAAKAR